MRKVDEIIKDIWQITQREIALGFGISQEHVDCFIDVHQYWDVCADNKAESLKSLNLPVVVIMLYE